jgi:hypothetical protein
MGLLEGTQRISTAREGPGGGGVDDVTMVHAVSALFRRTYKSRGQAIFYCGFIRFERDPEAVFADPGVMPALLDDVCALSGVKPLGINVGEIARARVGGRVLVLREDRITVET